MGALPSFVGMCARRTKKILPPELAQEATGEVAGIVFHPRERFGHPTSSRVRPADAHPCWQRGWVRCDFLPLCVEVRWDGCTEDYTGQGRPGVYHVEPVQDDWKLPANRVVTVDHPNAARLKRVRLTSRKDKTIDVSRTGVPLAPEHQVTFQNIQGQTVRGPEGQPKGLVVDLFRPHSMRGEERDAEYFQHVYMALGRARKLDWLLLQNFPRAEDGSFDWTVFENGPPDFLIEFTQRLRKLAAETMPSWFGRSGTSACLIGRQFQLALRIPL